MLVITHHQRLLDYIVPDRVHVMAEGRIVRSGDKELARALEAARLCRFRPGVARARGVSRGGDRDHRSRPYRGCRRRATGTSRWSSPTPAMTVPRGLPGRGGRRRTGSATHGFPTRKDEDWRYTRLEPILDGAVRAGVARAPSQARTDGDQRTRRPVSVAPVWSSSMAASRPSSPASTGCPPVRR